MTERCVHISERSVGPIHLVEKSAVVSERLFGPIKLSQKEVTIEEREFSEPVHIIGQSFDAVIFTISGVDFSVGATFIDTIFTTSASAACTIWGADYSLYPELSFVLWYTNPALHGTAHTHRKSGLPSSREYAIRIYAVDGAGRWAYMPSSTGWYVVQTADAIGEGGGKEPEKTVL